MKQHTKTILILGSLIGLCAGNALAQFPDSLFLEFDFEGFGNLVTMSPPRYAGDIVSGDPRLTGGSWWIEIDDSGWPPVGDPAARWAYIFTTYFEYNATYHFWTAVFDQNTLPAKPVWEIDHPMNGAMGGTLVVSSTFTDDDMDGVFDVEERMFGTFEGNLMVMKYGTGNFAKYCGDGAYNGAMFNDDPPNWIDDYVMGHCILDLVNCAIGTEEITWGGIKKLHR